MNLTLTIVHKTKKTNKLYYSVDNPYFAKVSRARWSKHATHDQITRLEGRNARDQIAFCAFQPFLEEVQTKAGYIHATHY